MFKTRKNLKIQIENNKKLNDQIIKIKRENVEYQKQIQGLLATIEILKKEIARLKTLLTKNKISYEKKEKKNGK